MQDPTFFVDPNRPPEVTPVYPLQDQPGAEFPLRAICAKWIEAIVLGKKLKEEQFGRDARDCMRFFNGPYDFLYSKEYLRTSAGAYGDAVESDAMSNFAAPTFKMTLNKVAEGVQLFGPVLYDQNPDRQVNPRELPPLPFGLLSSMQADPMMQQQVGMPEQMMMQQETTSKSQDEARASLLQWMLNYTPRELDLKTESRMAIDEALIKGAGLLWTRTYKPKGSNVTLIGSFFGSIDNLILDPDAERLKDCKWAVEECTEPVWEVEARYQLPPDTLKASIESYNQQAEVAVTGEAEPRRARGQTNDLVTYWKVYSKMGVGAKLKGLPNEAMRSVLDGFGDYAYLVIAKGVPYPLNIPPSVTSAPNQQDIMQRLEWPTPFWMDDAWPFEMLAFHWGPRQLWPISHFKPAMGELKLLNWLYSFIASKIQVTSRTFLAMKKSLGPEIKTKVLHGGDLTLLELEATHPGTIQELVQFLNHPEFNSDIWKVIEAVSENFDKRTGLSELMYGMSSRQMRSAQEAQVKADAVNVRPEDMQNKVEDWATAVAQLELMATRWHVGPNDVAPLMGPAAAFYWGQLVTGSDPLAVFHQLECSVEAGSARKPNRERDTANMNTAVQTWAPFFQQVAMRTGNFQQINALISDWCKVQGLPAEKYLVPNPPPMPPPTAPPEEPPQGAKK